ncbi:MAG: adenylate/guanylate cyclase domain-containing protein [Alphaproteobacteria bacterium]|jgi:class 3 adenylate cyclase|nr:adenylate/guanylate cyclase domain-containing protein [Alphaproteobacteria bacterium]
MVMVAVQRKLRYAASLPRLWPLLSDTSLLSEIDGQGSYQAEDELQADGTVLRRARSRGKFGPFMAEWTEDLGEWVEQRYIRQSRHMYKGLMTRADFIAEMAPTDDGFEIDLRLEMETAGPVGWLGARLGMMRQFAERVVTSVDRMIRTELDLWDGEGDREADGLLATGFGTAKPPAEALRRLDELVGGLAERIDEPELAERFSEYLRETPEVWLQRVRPLVLARQWRADPDKVVALFLAAHQMGLLRLRWEVLCPRCRNAKDVPDNLAELPKSVHCSTCNVDFEQDFSRNVELTFQPEAWLRPLQEGDFCMMGAASVPHIKVQRHVEAGEDLLVDPPLRPGGYRLRTAQAGPQVDIEWDGERGFPSVLAHDGRIEARAPSPDGPVLLSNRSDRTLTFVIEELAWRQDALTGDRAIAMAAFRQYCPEQLLRPGDDVAIAGVALLFTDLKGSTTMYEAIGDAAAYNLVRDHFDYLTAQIEARGGVLVKTMGDAVMAAFTEADAAVAAALAAQTGITEFNAGRADGGVIIKFGLHQGPCIAVNTDQRLDYFGSTVNVAARLQGESGGGEIVLSDAVMTAPGVRERLAETELPNPEKETASLRGVAQPVTLWRLAVNRTSAPSVARSAPSG